MDFLSAPFGGSSLFGDVTESVVEKSSRTPSSWLASFHQSTRGGGCDAIF